MRDLFEASRTAGGTHRSRPDLGRLNRELVNASGATGRAYGPGSHCGRCTKRCKSYRQDHYGIDSVPHLFPPKMPN